MKHGKLQENLIVVSGPSGVGKSTLLKRLFSDYSDKVDFSVSYTSRKPRPSEIDGVDYYFITAEKFQEMAKNNEFIEWANVHGNLYGTSSLEVERIKALGKYCILDIDVQGAVLVKETKIAAVYIFIAPPSVEILRERLLIRGTETDEVIQKRVTNAEKELTYKEKYDYIIVNASVDEAYNQLKNILFTTKTMEV